MGTLLWPMGSGGCWSPGEKWKSWIGERKGLAAGDVKERGLAPGSGK